MIKYTSILIAALFIINVNGLTMHLTQARSCLSMEAEENNQKYYINFHFNINQGPASLKIYDNTNGQILADSGYGTDYKDNLEVVFPMKGLYLLCFEKNDTKQIEVSVQFMKQNTDISFAGKEDLGRLTRRIGDFLVQIKRASWQYKQILSQHNKRHVQLHQFQGTHYIIYGGKLLAMVVVLTIQINLIRKIFD